MAFIRRQASLKRGRGVVLWDDWTAPERIIDQPQEPQGTTDAAPPTGPQCHTVAQSSGPARARANGNNRVGPAKTAYMAMVQNFATATKVRKSARRK